jgi:hypothetical protein
MSDGHRPAFSGRRSFIKHLTMLGAAMLGMRSASDNLVQALEQEDAQA